VNASLHDELMKRKLPCLAKQGGMKQLVQRHELIECLIISYELALLPHKPVKGLKTLVISTLTKLLHNLYLERTP
jgi:hypothetical protein